MPVQRRRQSAVTTRKPKVAGVRRSTPSDENPPHSVQKPGFAGSSRKTTAASSAKQAAKSIEGASPQPEPETKADRHRWWTSTRPVIVPLIVLLLAGSFLALGLWFTSQTQRLTGSASAVNHALVDIKGTTDVITSTKQALEIVSSYKYTDLDAAQRAVHAVIAGKFSGEYDSLFDQVKATAPAQKAVVTGQVVSIALRSLQGDNAVLLAFLTQNVTKTGVNQPVGLAYTVSVQRIDGKWKITELTPR